MILSYVIKNNTSSDVPLDPGEAWQFIVGVEDERDAYNQIGMNRSGFRRHLRATLASTCSQIDGESLAGS